MSANSALVKFKMVNGLIGSILEENKVSYRTLFPKLPQIDTEVRSKVEKLLESRERIKDDIDGDDDFEDFTDDLNLANYFLACRKFSDALRYYESALVKNPQSYSALCNKGLCLFKLSKLDDAITCYNEALSTYKNIPEAFFMKGKIMYAKQDFAEAVKHFQRALDLESENIDTKFYLAKSLVKMGNIQNGVEVLEGILEDHDHVDSLLLLGQTFLNQNEHQKAIVYLNKLEEISPNHIEAHLLLGKAHVSVENYNEAIIHFEKILNKTPNHIEAHLLLGKTNMEISNPNEAMSNFEKILEISPNHKDALNYKIQLLEKSGKLDDAIECCDQLVESTSEPRDQLLKKGILLFNNNKSSNALSIFNEILGKTKTNNVALIYKAKIFEQKQEFQEALLCIENILKSDPENTEALEKAAEISLKVGNYEKGLAYTNQLLTKSSSDVILERKSHLLSILGRHEEAGQICMELIKNNKTNAQTLYELGKIHLILNNFEKAVDFFDRAISICPMNSKIILKKSMACFSQQKYDDAILCLEQIPETDTLYNYAQFEKSKIQMLQGNTKQAIEILSKVVKTNDVFKLIASNEVIFESISNMFEFKELLK
ncbi:hypothetical protein C6990_01870 [Nitrosopumilus sp. b3]|uniref:tetratricopeptide repeat protein n=1 Tax=Nitrosopumilus sp. b3 TaxID=2109909 RepID=UPI0015F75A99|nr:tetratricopeptide repeat protein [Nitrosopumilus sp. b3]KAF6247251.1 hypothetical protein C6990_01870 [Nitrosopumilus sp. b3]